MKIITRIVALFLVPCLIVDPAIAAVAVNITLSPTRERGGDSCLFSKQAVAASIVNSEKPYSVADQGKEVRAYEQLQGRPAAPDEPVDPLKVVQDKLAKQKRLNEMRSFILEVLSAKGYAIRPEQLTDERLDPLDAASDDKLGREAVLNILRGIVTIRGGHAAEVASKLKILRKHSSDRAVTHSQTTPDNSFIESRTDSLLELVRMADRAVAALDAGEVFNVPVALEITNRLLKEETFLKQVSRDLPRAVIEETRKNLSSDSESARVRFDVLARRVLQFGSSKYLPDLFTSPLDEAWTNIRMAADHIRSRIHDPRIRKNALLMYLDLQLAHYNIAKKQLRLSDTDAVKLLAWVRSAGWLGAEDIEQAKKSRKGLLRSLRQPFPKVPSTYTLPDTLQLAVLQLFPSMPAKDQEKILEVHRSLNRREIIEDPRYSEWWRSEFASEGYFSEVDLRVNPSVVRNRFLVAPLVQVFAKIHEKIEGNGYREGDLIYPFPAADVSTGLLTSNATRIRMYGDLPFRSHKTIENENTLRMAYFVEKMKYGYTSQSMLDAIGCAKAPLLWELEALGATSINVNSGDGEGIYVIDFQWSYDGILPPTTYWIEYHEIQLDMKEIDFQHIVIPGRDTFYLHKASFDTALPISLWPPVVIAFEKLTGAGTRQADEAVRMGYIQIPFRDLLNGENPILQRMGGYANLTDGTLFIRPRVAPTHPARQVADPLRAA